MRSTQKIMIVLAAIGFSVASVSAQTTCDNVTILPAPSMPVICVERDGKVDIVLTVTATGSPRHTILADVPDVDIGTLEIVTPSLGTGSVDIVLSSPSGIPIRSVERIIMTKAASTQIVRIIDSSVSGSVGDVRVNQILASQFGSIVGDIVCEARFENGVRRGGNNMTDIVVVGSVVGDILIEDGLLRLSISGDLGSASDLSQVTVNNFSSSASIDLLEARNIYANIQTGRPGFASANVPVHAIRATGGGSSPGEFVGSLNTTAVTRSADVMLGIPSRLELMGALQGSFLFSIGIDSALTASELPAGSTITAGRLNGFPPNTGRIQLASGGLKGQVILNANNVTNDFLWFGPVVVGGTTLSPIPWYTQTSAQLGGGAVGYVPFAIHLQSSDPPDVGGPGTIFHSEFNGRLVPAGQSTALPPRPIEVEFYGPVTWDTAFAPFRLFMTGVSCTGSNVMDIDVTSWVVFEPVAGQPRRIRMRIRDGQSFPLPPGPYALVPNQRVATASCATDSQRPDRLFCVGTTAPNPVPVDVCTTYRFTLLRDCGNNGLDPGSTLEDTGCFWTGICDSVDFNNDGVFPDDADLQDFMNVMGGGACATCNDLDFNNDGVFPDDGDADAFRQVLAGACLPCIHLP